MAGEASTVAASKALRIERMLRGVIRSSLFLQLSACPVEWARRNSRRVPTQKPAAFAPGGGAFASLHPVNRVGKGGGWKLCWRRDQRFSRSKSSQDRPSSASAS